MVRILLFLMMASQFLCAQSQDGIYYLRVGESFSVKFTDYTLEQCTDELFFLKLNDSTYLFSEHLDYTDLAQTIKLKLKVAYDSVVVDAAYENKYGVLISETEGAFIYDGQEPGSSHFSGWRKAKVLDENRKYSLWFFGNGKGFINNAPPEMEKSKVKKWCHLKDWCPDNEVTVFCARMIIRIKIYDQGIVRSYYLNFDRRVGEC